MNSFKKCPVVPCLAGIPSCPFSLAYKIVGVENHLGNDLDFTKLVNYSYNNAIRPTITNYFLSSLVCLERFWPK